MSITASQKTSLEDAEFLHDHVCGDLVVLKMQVDYLRKHTTSALQKRELRSMDSLVDEIIASIRARSRNKLREADVEASSLYTQTGRCLRTFEQRTRIRTRFTKTGPDKDLSNEICATVLEILKEALANIVRHARATEVRVDAARHEKFLAVSICDNGVGARKSVIQNPDGVGLLTIHRRVTAFGGTVHFRGATGRGFEVFLRIPLGSALTKSYRSTLIPR